MIRAMGQATRWAICCALLVGGCKQIGWWYRGESENTGDASVIAGKKLCILVYAEDETVAQFPLVQFEVAAWVADYLKQGRNLEIVDPKIVAQYQERNVDWDAQPCAEVGRTFKADMVLAINLVRFTTRDAKTPELYQGRVEAACTLYDCSAPPRRQEVWSDVVRGTYPEGKPILVTQVQQRQIRGAMLRMLADRLARRLLHRKETGT